MTKSDAVSIVRSIRSCWAEDADLDLRDLADLLDYILESIPYEEDE